MAYTIPGYNHPVGISVSSVQFHADAADSTIVGFAILCVDYESQPVQVHLRVPSQGQSTSQVIAAGRKILAQVFDDLANTLRSDKDWVD